MRVFFQKPYLIFLLLIVFFELLSFLGYLVPLINRFAFLLISLSFLFLTFWKLEYGIFVLLAELFIGSKGYLFYLPIGPIKISLRMILFSLVMLIWLIGIIRKKYKLNFLHSKFFKFYFLFSIFYLWGVLAGFLYRNSKDLIFFDANAWLYFLLVFPIFDVIKKEHLDKIFKILSAAISWLAIKTFILFFIFTHQIPFITIDLYRWTRRHGLGEITQLDSFYRIFLQSQIYSLIGFFIFLSIFVFLLKKKKVSFFSFLSLFLSVVPILISFSRSFWLGFVFTLIIFFLFLKIKENFSCFDLGKIFFIILLVFLLSFGLIWLSLRLPPKIRIDLASLVEKRMEIEEPATSSRLLQLPHLLDAILEKPIFGAGFGKTISYFSTDPRILGYYTTYAFEWGYLDIWLKIGFVGLSVFLIFIGKIFKEGWKIVENCKLKIENFQKSLILGLLSGLVALGMTHFTSPYLNHPLGIGYLIICLTIFNQISYESGYSNCHLE
ncbi:MAG: O-antigen ligase family protein [Patescibacteria group bacterium]|nr:O-antigen ligase family protein [Patescibacteria group bacterium]